MATSKAKKQSDSGAADEPVEAMAAASDEGGDEPKQPAKSATVTGPGTGSAAPADDQERMPSTTVLATDAGPLVPTDVQKVHEPADGHPESSTNTVGASAGLQSIAGANHVRIHDEEGNDVDVDDVFTEPEGPSRMVTVKRRVFETYTQPKGRTPLTRLLFNAGRRVSLAEAERFKADKRAQLEAEGR